MTTEKNWFLKAIDDAKECFTNFVDEMCEQWERDREVSNDLHNDYADGDSYHHENHVDRSYRLTEAAALLDELSEYEESDDGLWQGLDPREAVSAQAAYTYGNAVLDQWRDLVSDLNSDLSDLRDTVEANPVQTWFIERQTSAESDEWERLPGDYDTEAEATDDIPTDEDGAVFRVQHEDYDDATSDAVDLAGARYIRLYCELINDDREDCDGMVGAALDAAGTGDYTAALALADWLQENGKDYKAQAVRNAVA